MARDSIGLEQLSPDPLTTSPVPYVALSPGNRGQKRSSAVAGLDPPKTGIARRRTGKSPSPSKSALQVQDFIIETPRRRIAQRLNDVQYTTMNAEGGLSPWRIRVTVQAEPDEQENQPLDEVNIRRSPMKGRSRSPTKSRKSPSKSSPPPVETTTLTTRVPLRGLSPTPSAPSRSPRKPRSTPKRSGAKAVGGRKATPRPKKPEATILEDEEGGGSAARAAASSGQPGSREAERRSGSKSLPVANLREPESSIMKPNLTRSSLGLFSRSPTLRSTRLFRSRRSEEELQRRRYEPSFLDPSTFVSSDSPRQPEDMHNSSVRPKLRQDQAGNIYNDSRVEYGDPRQDRSSSAGGGSDVETTSPIDDINSRINAGEDFTMISVASLHTAANLSNLHSQPGRMDENTASKETQPVIREDDMLPDRPQIHAQQASQNVNSKLPTPDTSSSSELGEPPEITLSDSPGDLHFGAPDLPELPSARPQTPLEQAPEPSSRPPPFRASLKPYVAPYSAQRQPRLGPSPLARVVRAGSALQDVIISPTNASNDLSSPFRSPAKGPISSSLLPDQEEEREDPFLPSAASSRPKRPADHGSGAELGDDHFSSSPCRFWRFSAARDTLNVDHVPARDPGSSSRKRANVSSPPQIEPKRRSIQYPNLLPPPSYRSSTRSHMTVASTTPDGLPPVAEASHSSSFWIRQAHKQSESGTPAPRQIPLLEASPKAQNKPLAREDSSVHVMGDASLQEAVAYFQEQGEKRRSQSRNAEEATIHSALPDEEYSQKSDEENQTPSMSSQLYDDLMADRTFDDHPDPSDVRYYHDDPSTDPTEEYLSDDTDDILDEIEALSSPGHNREEGGDGEPLTQKQGLVDTSASKQHLPEGSAYKPGDEIVEAESEDESMSLPVKGRYDAEDHADNRNLGDDEFGELSASDEAAIETPDETPEQSFQDDDSNAQALQSSPHQQPRSSPPARSADRQQKLPLPETCPGNYVPKFDLLRSPSVSGSLTALALHTEAAVAEYDALVPQPAPSTNSSPSWPPSWQWRHWKALSDLWHAHFPRYTPAHPASERVYNHRQMGNMIVDIEDWHNDSDGEIQQLGRDQGRCWVLLEDVAVQLYAWEVEVVRLYSEILTTEIRASGGETQVAKMPEGWQFLGRKLAALKKQEAFSSGQGEKEAWRAEARERRKEVLGLTKGEDLVRRRREEKRWAERSVMGRAWEWVKCSTYLG